MRSEVASRNREIRAEAGCGDREDHEVLKILALCFCSATHHS